MTLGRLRFIPAWLKAGGAGVSVIAILLLTLRVACSPAKENWFCIHLGRGIDFIDRPAWPILGPLYRAARTSLGIRQLGPDLWGGLDMPTRWSSALSYYTLLFTGLSSVSSYGLSYTSHERHGGASLTVTIRRNRLAAESAQPKRPFCTCNVFNPMQILGGRNVSS
jgi:hypothetical protein